MPLLNRCQQSLGHHKQQGVALVTVLFLFALVVVVVGSLLTSTQNEVNRFASYQASEQAWQLCLSGEEYAGQLLRDDLKSGPNVDHLHEPWAEESQRVEIDGGYFEVLIVDAQGKFNVNNLVRDGKEDPQMKAVLQTLINHAVDDSTLSAKLAAQAVDWMDSDKTGGTEEFDYLTEDIPYRPPNGPVASPEEWRWLKDMEAELYAMLRPLLLEEMRALPAGTLININTVSPVVLAAMAGVPDSVAETMVDQIRANKDGFANISAALSMLSPSARQQLQSYFTSKSDYYEIQVRARFLDQYAYVRTLVRRNAQVTGGQATLEVISRDRGRRFLFPFSEDYNGLLTQERRNDALSSGL